MIPLNETAIKQTILTWRKSLGWGVRRGPEIAPGTLAAERENFGQVVMARREVRLSRPVVGKPARRRKNLSWRGHERHHPHLL